jgi:hypothetical protein
LFFLFYVEEDIVDKETREESKEKRRIGERSGLK